MDVEICASASAQIVSSIEDLVIKILAGLPLASLRVSKSVCKRWLHLITDPRFNALRSRNPKADHPCFLLLQVFSEFAYVPLASGITSIQSPLVSTAASFPFYADNLKVLQSCNGLLLLHDHGPDYDEAEDDPPLSVKLSKRKLYVYNPATNHCKLLPPPPLWNPYRRLRYMALAFDPTVSPHYKVVYPPVRHDDGRVELHVYSSQTGEWKACAHTGLIHTHFHRFNSRVVYWRGALHWMSPADVFHLSCLSDDEEPILQVEDHLSLNGSSYSFRDRLFVSRDRLLRVRILEEPTLQVDVYEMKNNNDAWSIRYRLNLQSAPLGPHFNVLAIVLGETDKGSFLVLEDELLTLLQYNISSNTFHRLCDLTTQTQRLHQASYNSFLFTPSLVGL